jgi:hypothetical protein
MIKTLALVILALGCDQAGRQVTDGIPMEKETRPMNTSGDAGVIAVNYSRSLGRFGSEIIRVARDGESGLKRSYNDDGQPEIGVWQHAIARSMFDELLRRLRVSNYQNISAAGMVEPGAALVTVGEQRAGEKVPQLRSFRPGQTELAPVIECISGIMTELRKHPTRVLRGDARWREPELKKRSKGEIDLKLTNMGTQEIKISNPLHAGSRRFNGLRIEFARPSGEMVKDIEFSAADVRAPTGTPTTVELGLTPGQALSLSLQVELALSAGSYRTHLSVASHAGSSVGNEFVSGTLSFDLGDVKIAR